MLKLSPALLLSASLILSAVLLANAPTIDAGAPQPTHVNFTLTYGRGQTRVIGTVPQNRTLVLRDFMAASGRGKFVVLADGNSISPGFVVGGDAGEHSSFAEGFHIEGGSVLSIRRTGAIAIDEVDLYVGGTLR